MLGLHLAVVGPYLAFYQPTTGQNLNFMNFGGKAVCGPKIIPKSTKKSIAAVAGGKQAVSPP